MRGIEDFVDYKFKYTPDELAEIVATYEPNFNLFRVKKQLGEKIWYGSPTNEIEFEIWLRSRLDPIWFIDNLVYVESDDTYVRNPLYDIQKKVLDYQQKYWFVQILKARQTGISTTYRRFLIWGFLFFPSWNAAVISRTGDNAKSYLNKLKIELKHLSQRHPYLIPSIVDWQKQSISNENDTRIIATTTTSDAARGEVMRFIVVDEAAFCNEISNFYKSVSMTLTVKLASKLKEADKNPHKHIPDAPFGMAIISTPNKKRGIGRWFYETWTQNSKAFETYLADYERYKRNEITEEPKAPLISTITVRWQDIPAYDERWYKAQCELLNNNELDIRQELEMEFIDDGADIFTKTFFNSYVLTDPIEVRYPIAGYPDYGMHIYRQPEENGIYIMGVDIATGDTIGDDPDRHAFTIIDLYGETYADYISAHIDQTEFARHAYEAGRYYNDALAIIERNTGAVVINMFLDGIVLVDQYLGAYPSMYKYTDVTKTKNRVAKQIYGFPTTSKTRPGLVHDAYTDVMTNTTRLKSARLFDELKGLTIINGVIKAPPGEHDDLFFSRALALRARRDVYKIFVGYDAARIEETMRNYNTKLYEPMMYMNLEKDEREFVEAAIENDANVTADDVTELLKQYRYIKQKRGSWRF